MLLSPSFAPSDCAFHILFAHEAVIGLQIKLVIWRWRWQCVVCAAVTASSAVRAFVLLPTDCDCDERSKCVATKQHRHTHTHTDRARLWIGMEKHVFSFYFCSLCADLTHERSQPSILCRLFVLRFIFLFFIITSSTAKALCAVLP